jgi:hypothetical protein
MVYQVISDCVPLKGTEQSSMLCLHLANVQAVVSAQ